MNARHLPGYGSQTAIGLSGIGEPSIIERQDLMDLALQRAIGYKIQEKALGGLNRQTQLRLSTLKSASGRGKASTAERSSPKLKSGTKLLREWQGKVHEVLALDDGLFAYAGKTYRSLTTIARQVTGVHQSGPKFFGLKIPQTSADG